MHKRNMNCEKVAGLIERFLEKRSSYAQEWNDFVEIPQNDGMVDAYRKRCYELEPQLEAPEPAAVAELESLVKALRSFSF
jgi:hypothetical protein